MEFLKVKNPKFVLNYVESWVSLHLTISFLFQIKMAIIRLSGKTFVSSLDFPRKCSNACSFNNNFGSSNESIAQRSRISDDLNIPGGNRKLYIHCTFWTNTFISWKSIFFLQNLKFRTQGLEVGVKILKQEDGLR